MCNCNSIWAQEAKNLVLSNKISYEEKVVLDYLLNNNYCGKTNTALINDVVAYLNNNSSTKYSREIFQHNILIPLKQKGVIATLIYPGHKGGLFIPCNTNEIKEIYKQVLNRVLSELNNVQPIVSSSSINQNIITLITMVQNEINNL